MTIKKPRLFFIDIKGEPTYDLVGLETPLKNLFIVEKTIFEGNIKATMFLAEQFKPDIIVFNLSTYDKQKTKMLDIFIKLKRRFSSVTPIFLHRQGHPKRDLICCWPLEEHDLPIYLFFTKDFSQIRRSTPGGFGEIVNFSVEVEKSYKQHLRNLKFKSPIKT